MTRMLALLALGFLVSCSSATKTVSQEAQRVQRLAEESTQKAVSIQDNGEHALAQIQLAIDTGDVGPLALPFLELATEDLLIMQEAAAEIAVSTQDISKAAGRVLNEVPNLEDKVPMWQRLLNKYGTVLMLGGIIFLLLYFAPITRKVIAWIAKLIPGVVPTDTRASAALAAEAVVENKAAPVIREQIAIDRTDPVYNEAFKQEKAKLESSPTQ